MTLNAECYLRDTIEILLRQTIIPDEIIVADSESDDATRTIASEYDKVKILNISRDDFDHGGSRDYALRQSNSDYILFFTQDAMIEQIDYIERIISNFKDEKVAMVCARQTPKPEAWPYEKLIREFNYPAKRRENTKDDIKKYGIKTFYMSDACSAYRKDIYLSLSGFEHPILTNEDMLIAGRAIINGYKTIYDPEAYVLHSHNFSFKQEFKRNFDVAAFMKIHKDIFEDLKIEGEGIKLVKFVSKNLIKEKHFIWLLRFMIICISKYAGTLKGRKYDKLSVKQLYKYSANKNYWRKTMLENL